MVENPKFTTIICLNSMEMTFPGQDPKKGGVTYLALDSLVYYFDNSACPLLFTN